MAKKLNLFRRYHAYKLSRLVAEVQKAENRINNYKEYIPVLKGELEVKRERAIAKQQIKIERKYQAVVYDASNKKELFDFLTEKEVIKLRKKLRNKYRVEREKGRRAISKLKAKELPYLEKEKQFNLKLEKMEMVHQEQIDAFVEKRLQQFKDEEASINKSQASTEEKAKAYEERHNKLTEIRNLYTDKYMVKFSKEEKYVNKHINRATHNLSKKKPLLDNTLNSVDHSNYSFAEGNILEIKNLAMHFGGVKAVDDLTFDVKEKEIFGLIGPNGAGKTTVFNCLTKFYQPTRGQMYFKSKLGESINLNELVVHDVITKGIVRTFQNLEVIKEVSVLDNLLIAAHRQYTAGLFDHILHTRKLSIEESVIRGRAERVLHFMGLTAYRDFYAWGLPYGTLKKVEIARTLMNNPQLIVLDEPAAGLNDTETADLAKLIRKIRDEYQVAILLVEHDMGLVMEVCDRICAISFGRMLALGTPKDIQSNPDVQAAYLGASEGE